MESSPPVLSSLLLSLSGVSSLSLSLSGLSSSARVDARFSQEGQASVVLMVCQVL